MPSSSGLSTDRQIAALKPRDNPFEVAVAGARGLYIRVFPTAARKFEYRYTSKGGSRRRMVLGAWPDLSLSEARLRASQLRQSVHDGADPAETKALEKVQARTGETFSELAEAYWAAAARGLHGGRRRPKREATIQTEKSWWRTHVEKKLGHRRYQDLRRTDIRLFMKALVMESRLAPASIAAVGALIQSILQYAVLEEKIDANPAAGLARPLALTSRDRLFSDDAMTTIWKTARTAATERDPTRSPRAQLSPEMGLAIQFLILTLTRRAETAGARWSEFDMKAGLWTIPASRTKALHTHIVPLTETMVGILEEMRKRHPVRAAVFPPLRGRGDHLDPHALTRAFARICEQHHLPAGSPHDVRRTGVTTLIGRYRVPRMIAGLLLGHTIREGAAATSIYDRHSYLPEKHEALKIWGRHLEALEQAGAEASGGFDGGKAAIVSSMPALPAPQGYRDHRER
ncbi:MAG: integrase arm-type DNA-binding domain-containing protein [Caulobacteraceae bacterium]|nr:integrase arm-type DNA-binding domain-containing protein [Caulobacteraceae bacterium]